MISVVEKNWHTIDKCRICKNPNLVEIIDLGMMELSGHFPRPNEIVDSAPLTLVKCFGAEACGLVQLAHSYSLSEMYGLNYGYRSGLNQSMVRHLEQHVRNLESKLTLVEQDVVIDIGSNDCSLLKKYRSPEVRKIGIDPTIKKFSSFYPSDVVQIADFFPNPVVKEILNGRKAKIITSMAMFYDLEDPSAFVASIAENLDGEGLWLFEQSYLPIMLDKTSYDTICHEHLEYYCIKQIKWMLDRTDLKIVDIQFNDINGGSFSVVVAHEDSSHTEFSRLQELLDAEKSCDSLETFEDFRLRVLRHGRELHDRIIELKSLGHRVLGYGASTKGNVILQHCKIGPALMPMVLEVNLDKLGCTTPGGRVPIVNEKDFVLEAMDILLPLPWHFRNIFEEKLSGFLEKGGQILYPLPKIDLVGKKNTSEIGARV